MTTTWITICDTCKREGWDAESNSLTDGEKLAQLVEQAASTSTVKTRRISCTMGCERACNVIVQGDGKLCYSLGRFDPDEVSAQAILEYAEKHAESETGQVPFRDWPQGVKGHFVSRHAPLPRN